MACIANASTFPKVVDDVAILFEYDDYGDDELYEQEYHGTGDTGGTAE